MSWLAAARRIADEVLFPAAPTVDVADRVPPEHLDLLAVEGFYGIAAADIDYPELCRVVETLAGGCLTTAFVWAQHHGALRPVVGSSHAGIRETWLDPLARGVVRGGIAQAALRPGPPSVRAEPIPGGYLFTGEAPWVTGWDMIDVVHTAARDASDTVIWALVDAVPGPTLTVTPLHLTAANASRTVLVRFSGHPVTQDRVTGTFPYREWPERDAASLRFNGSFALGVAGRCARLAGSATLAAAVDDCRAALDEATPQTLPVARAAACELAVRAAAALTVSAGSRAVLRGEHAERLVREAAFLLVFGTRPAIRADLLARLDR